MGLSCKFSLKPIHYHCSLELAADVKLVLIDAWPQNFPAYPCFVQPCCCLGHEVGKYPGLAKETLRLRSDCRYQIPVWALGCIHHWLHVMGPCQVFRDLGIYSVGTHAMHGYAVLSELGEYLNPHHTLVIELLTALTHPLLGNLWRFRVT